MKYLILIYGNPQSRELWNGFSPEERAEGLQVYTALVEDLVRSGELVVTEALADPATARRVHVREGRTTTTDGPFAEVKEQVGGFFLVECDSMQRAVEIAARIPEAAMGLVEVRPVMDLSGFDIEQQA